LLDYNLPDSPFNNIPYKNQTSLAPLRQYYMTTLGTAWQLGIENYVGNFEKGKEADFIVVDLTASPELRWRYQTNKEMQYRPDINASRYASYSRYTAKFTSEFLRNMNEQISAEFPNRRYIEITSYAQWQDLLLLADQLFVVSTMPSDRTIKATYIMGKLQYLREANYLSSLNSNYRAQIVHFLNSGGKVGM
jgi:hypothetical protein